MKWELRKEAVALWEESNNHLDSFQSLPLNKQEMVDASRGISPRRLMALVAAAETLGIKPSLEIFQEAYQWASFCCTVDDM